MLLLQHYIQLSAAKYLFRSKTVENSTVEEVAGSGAEPGALSAGVRS